VETIRPDGFVFENVTGLLNMEGGTVFEMIRRELQILDNPLVPWVLRPRNTPSLSGATRLFLMSLPKRWEKVMPPEPSTSMEAEVSLFCRTQQAVSAEDALADLPPLPPRPRRFIRRLSLRTAAPVSSIDARASRRRRVISRRFASERALRFSPQNILRVRNAHHPIVLQAQLLSVPSPR